jgi:hypothetical protein
MAKQLQLFDILNESLYMTQKSQPDYIKSPKDFKNKGSGL